MKQNRTRTALADAYMHLLNDYTIDRITVKMITDAVGCSRKTFYYYFTDVYVLTQYVFELRVQQFLDTNGNVVGRHHGAVRYTCGQRKGLGLALGAPVYVCGKDMEKNTVTVGPESELFKTTLIAGDFNWISVPELTAPMRVKAKARYRQVEQPATAYPLENGLVKVVFDEPQRAITRGQAVVLYDGDVVVGGGTIL